MTRFSSNVHWNKVLATQKCLCCAVDCVFYFTYGVVHDGLKQFSTHYGFIQFFAASRVSVNVDGVREQATSLPRQNLKIQ